MYFAKKKNPTLGTTLPSTSTLGLKITSAAMSPATRGRKENRVMRRGFVRWPSRRGSKFELYFQAESLEFKVNWNCPLFASTTCPSAQSDPVSSL